MRSRSTAALAAVMCVAAIGCDSSGTAPTGTVPSLPASTTSSASAAPTTTDKQIDYSRLLLQPADVSDSEDTFKEQSSTPSGPDGLPGASALFVNQDDTRAISNAIVIYPDADTAANTLKAALPTIDTTIAGATPRPAPVGSNGTIAVGTSPDGSKAATLLLFTEGPALARLDFQSALGDVTTDQYVINVGKMQQIALRTGLS
jgi:hypothetical protein